MNTKRLFIILIVILTVFSLPSIFAQNKERKNLKVRIPLTFGVGSYTGFGFNSPYTEFGSGSEVENRDIRAGALVTFSPTGKLCCGKTHSIGIEAGGVYKSPIGIFGGGGLKYSNLYFNEYRDSKSAIRPFVEVGWGDKKGKVMISYKHRFKGNDKFNNLSGDEISFAINHNNFRFQPIYGNYRFNATSDTLGKCGNQPCLKYNENTFLFRFTYFIPVLN